MDFGKFVTGFLVVMGIGKLFFFSSQEKGGEERRRKFRGE